MQDDFVTGTCDGTGAAINVCLGFIPRRVVVRNVEDAGTKLPIIEWNDEMVNISAQDEGVKTVGISDTDIDRTVMASSGISKYTGGDKIYFDKNTSNCWEYAPDHASAGTSVEEVYVDGRYKRASSSAAAYKCIGDAIEPNPVHGCIVMTPAGFTIGADSDINQDGEQLIWEAWR